MLSGSVAPRRAPLIACEISMLAARHAALFCRSMKRVRAQTRMNLRSPLPCQPSQTYLYPSRR